SAWDATGNSIIALSRHQYFNPRIRVGCDMVGLSNSILILPISIHASAWDATIARWIYQKTNCRFQSTHPRGMRRTVTGIKQVDNHISIHASAWDATLKLGE
ncbi:hypothetical protein BAZO_10957, partial [Schinkia azotoformans LMG 9581]